MASELDQETIFLDSPQVELTRRIITSLADATPSPRVGRSLARLMRQAGLQNVGSQAIVINVPFGMVRIGIGGHLDKCVQQGMIPAQDTERWLQLLVEANGVGEFHAGAIVFSAVGDKP